MPTLLFVGDSANELICFLMCPLQRQQWVLLCNCLVGASPYSHYVMTIPRGGERGRVERRCGGGNKGSGRPWVGGLVMFGLMGIAVVVGGGWGTGWRWVGCAWVAFWGWG